MHANDLDFDPYALLDLTPDATLEEITRRYRKLTRAPRRGKGQPPPSEQEAAELERQRRNLKLAYGIVKDTARRVAQARARAARERGAIDGADADDAGAVDGYGGHERLDAEWLAERVTGDLRAGGVLARALPEYEERPAQIEMAQIVAGALPADEHVAIEAGTGTGKSLAYLLPIVRSKKVALISTANKALQEQLYYKDIPFVQRHVRQFKAALVKGMGNYLCLDRLEQAQRMPPFPYSPAYEHMLELLPRRDAAEPAGDRGHDGADVYGDDTRGERSEVGADADDQRAEWDGDLELLPETLPTAVRAHIAADSEQCAWRACPFFGDCYVRKMREHAEEARVIVVNHTLLLLDAELDGWLLPQRDVVILDEAHHLEDEATRAFTISVSPGRVLSLLALHRVREHADGDKLQAAQEANVQAWEALERLVGHDLRGRRMLREPLEEGLRLASLVDDVATSLRYNRPEQMDDKEEQLYDKVVKRARMVASALRIAFGVAEPERYVYYAERAASMVDGGSGGGRRAMLALSVSAAPLGVADLLAEKLFDRVPVVATSATLAIGGDFSFFRRRVGLPLAREAVLPLAFDYAHHALLYVPRLRHEPAYGAGSDDYLAELASEMRELVAASRGRAFLLFSSQRALRAVLDQLAGPLDDLGCSPLVQGAGMGRVELLRRFRTEPRPVLFGLKSFWEGVDVAGETLSLVAIDKLPFAPPDDPIQAARVAQMKAAGENWFGGYTLPLAILQLKQGLGRLLRTRDDRGVMAVLDTRLHTKSYGREVLAALPPARRTNDIAEVRAFFAQR